MNESGKKYLREVNLIDGMIDVYSVLDAFDVKCPARQHAIKKLLCTGIRGKGDEMQDLKEAGDAIERAIQLHDGTRGKIETDNFNLIDYLEKQKRWAGKEFGKGKLTTSILNHINREVEEVKAKPDDLYEWADILILAFEGAMRRGYSAEEVISAMVEKQNINFNRKWPKSDESNNKPIEHIDG